MATHEQTLERLQYLATLYRQGYRSDTIDRSLDKIIALERAAAHREYADLRERLQAFETRYLHGCRQLEYLLRDVGVGASTPGHP